MSFKTQEGNPDQLLAINLVDTLTQTNHAYLMEKYK